MNFLYKICISLFLILPLYSKNSLSEGTSVKCREGCIKEYQRLTLPITTQKSTNVDRAYLEKFLSESDHKKIFSAINTSKKKDSNNIDDIFIAVPKENSKIIITPRDSKLGVGTSFTAEINYNDFLDNCIKGCDKEK